jgi:hypothetical protein
MRRIAIALAAGLLMASVAGSVIASGPATRGFLPANAHPHGRSLGDMSNEWNRWAWGNGDENGPILSVRCEPSQLDPKVWFLPASLGGEWTATCNVPHGALLLVMAGMSECSQASGDGSNEAELRACVAQGSGILPDYAAVSLDGRMATDLAAYDITTDVMTLPPNNLISADPTMAIGRGYFLVTAPLSTGTHTLRVYDEWDAIDFQAGITFTIVVH